MSVEGRSELDRAIDLLRGVEYGAQSLTHFELGRAYEGLDQRERPSEACTTAAALAPGTILDRVRARVREIGRERSRRGIIK